MKRQLGAVLAVLALFCVPAMWAQSDSTDSSSSSSSSASDGSSSSAVSSPTIGTSTSGGTVPGSYTDPIYQVASGDPQNSSGTNPDGSDSQTQTGPQSTFTHPEQLPALSAINDVTRNTGLGLSFNSGSLTDYVWGGHGNNYYQQMGMFAGGISLSQIRSKSLVQLSYTGGINVTSLGLQGASTYNQLSQSALARIMWNFASNWQLKIKDNYVYTDDPFQPFLTYVGEPQPNQPNPTVYVPNAVYEQNMGTIDIAHRLTAHDSIVFTGAESFQKYERGGLTSLWNSYTYGGGGYYQHSFSARFSAGGGANFTAMDFGHGESRSGVTMMESFVTYKISPGFSISAWAGPELTNSKNLIVLGCLPPYGCLIEEKHTSQWSSAEGGTIAYYKNGNSIRANFSRSVADGGGLLGASNLYQATIAYARPLSRLWGFSAAYMYSDSKSIFQSIDQYWIASQGMLNFTRKIGDSWNGSVFLLFIDQRQNLFSTLGAPAGSSATAGLGLTLRYIWGHSLGR